jgi:two-component system, LytTR family, response regulator
LLKELRSMLAEHEIIDVVGDAETVTQAAELVHAKKPDVLFLDIQLLGETDCDQMSTTSSESKTGSTDPTAFTFARSPSHW